jgi:pyrroline-5-carboxylate reductase
MCGDMKLGVIGCGKMATALVKGALAQGVVKGVDVIGVARTEASRLRFSEQTGARNTISIEEVVRESEVLILATKPHDIPGIIQMAELGKFPDKLFISVAAGVTLGAMEKLTGGTGRFIRTMPNTPALVGKGAAAFSLGSNCGVVDREIVQSILGAVGLSVEVPERLIDAVTGLSGSGPAYIYLVIEALADGGVQAGLPRIDALKLAAQTVAGAAAMVLETGLHPAVLKDMVTSPGGTTIAGLAALEDGAIRSSFIAAVSAAVARAKELGKS